MWNVHDVRGCKWGINETVGGYIEKHRYVSSVHVRVREKCGVITRLQENGEG